MPKKIDIERYKGFNELVVGETMEVDVNHISIYISREKFGRVKPGTFLIVVSDEGGLIGVVGTKVSKTKYGGEFISIFLNYGDDAKKMYGDLENEYVYTVDLIPIYEVDVDGYIKPSFTIFVKPHQPVYLLEDYDIKNLVFDGMLNLSFLLYIKLDDYILCRNLFQVIYDIVRDEVSLDDLLYQFLQYAYRNGSSLDIVVNIFKEVVGNLDQG
ncbi:MAG TPA: hypothetical protein EYH44_05490 [Thermoprotei archaeon]|nr:hypothetical protein [Thermoprotei archaeon]